MGNRILKRHVLSATLRKVNEDFSAALQKVNEDPGRAFDIVLAAQSVVAAKHPDIVALNRSLRGIKSAAVKYLNKQVNDLVWEAGDTQDYIGLGSTVHFYGAVEAGGRSSARIEVNFMKPKKTPGEYGVVVTAYGKGGRQLFAGRMDDSSLADLKGKPASWLDKAVQSVKKNLSGSLEEEKERLLSAVEEALEVASKVVPSLKEIQSAIKKSKNLLTDIGEIRSLAYHTPVHDLEYPLKRIMTLADELKRSGG